MTGRKRTPAPLAKLRGQPGHRKARTEPQFDPSIPEAPAFLDDDGIFEWHRITSMMSNSGVMSTAYRALLASYCDTWSEFVKLKAQCEGVERWKISQNGYPYEDPRYVRLGKVKEQLDKKCGMLGFTPTALSKIVNIGTNQGMTIQEALASRQMKLPVKK